MQYLFVEDPKLFEVPKDLSAFRCVILIEKTIDAADRAKISKQLVDAGCLYAMAWGIDCSSWDDSIDEANIDQFFPRSVPDNKFVMTTWHSKESIEEVFFFAKFNAVLSYDNIKLVDLLVLDLGLIPREAEIMRVYETA